jgi:hypothetical protein
MDLRELHGHLSTWSTVLLWASHFGTGTVAGPFSAVALATISGVANGNYQAYVRQDCGVLDGISENSSPVNFQHRGR